MVKNDVTIKESILEEITWDNQVSVLDLDVQVEDGIVTLHGTVPNFNSRRRLEKDVLAIDGVKDITNNISIDFSGVAETSDDKIRDFIIELLEWNSLIPDLKIEIRVNDGFVKVEGSVDYLWKKDYVENIIAQVRSVKGIHNHLTVVPSRSVEDRLIAENILSSFRRRKKILQDIITVKVNKGNVTLKGTIPSGISRLIITDLVKNTEGVKEIKDELGIQT